MKRALDPTDKESFADWLDSLSKALSDANDAAIDAVRSRRKRMLARAELSRRLTDALDRIGQLLDAARRGLGPTLHRTPDLMAEPPPDEPPT